LCHGNGAKSAHLSLDFALDYPDDLCCIFVSMTNSPKMLKPKLINTPLFINTLLPLLYVQSLRQKPDFMLGISNLWWNMESSGENIQRAKMNLISWLYDIPFIFAVNRKEAER
jgi:hypothetical protein